MKKVGHRNFRESKLPIKLEKAQNGANGITLVALVVTIIVLLILAGISINMLTGDNSILSRAVEAREETVIADEKEKVKVAYLSATVNNLGDTVTQGDLQEELDKVAIASVTDNGDGSLNVLFCDTGHNYSVESGTVELVVGEDSSKMAFFDVGSVVTEKMFNLAEEGEIVYVYYAENLSIDGIKKYPGTPDLSAMTEENIVSWSDLYSGYAENPELFSGMLPEGTELCPIYMWFEESGEQEYRDILGNTYSGTGYEDTSSSRTVTTGTIYWWCESNNVYLNPDSSYMFIGLSYLSDISGLQSLKADYATDMSWFLNSFFNQKLDSFDSLSNWDISNVTNLSYALGGYENMATLEGLRYWDTSSVENMSGFLGDLLDTAPTAIYDLSPLANWDVSGVTNMSRLFAGCEFTNLSALSNWDVSNVTNMSQMFCGCSSLEDASGINDWDVSKVTDFGGMFQGVDESLYPTFTKVSGTWDSGGTFTKAE